MHLIWLKSRPLDKAARELVELMRAAPQDLDAPLLLLFSPLR